ncbi:MAG: glutamate-5-semialdehyde dehydrogenase [Opitutales bacterium]|nr:glutamate-5-semialdehyde dehydrogenase [Opitutales bacterium]
MNLEETVINIAKNARASALKLAAASTAQKNSALNILADLIEKSQNQIIAENEKDLNGAAGISSAFKDRLTLTPARISAMAEGVRQVAALPDPVGEIIDSKVRPNGLKIEKTRTPIGVIAIIYESRPNVTIDCAALCLKSGNASILRGGKEAFNSNMFLAGLVREALEKAGLDGDCVQIVPTCDRAAMNTLLKLDKFIDCIIPRGGESLIRFVVQNSTIPVIKHYKGVCNVYIDEFADLKTAVEIAVNAKCQRPSACNAAENLLVSSAVKPFMAEIAKALIARGVKFKADAEAREYLAANGVNAEPASDDDFETEYCSLEISAKFVGGVKEAADFINAHSSGHSDAIVSSCAKNAEYFLNAVDSSCVYWNASTRFTDGFEFGLGAEIGISTDKLHARGPMGLAELCSYKYKIFGDGQIRE